MDRNKASIAVDLLERVAAGKLEGSEALANWPEGFESDDLLKASWHDLSHSAADGDIRQKDGRYKDYQVSLLIKRANQIKEEFGAM